MSPSHLYKKARVALIQVSHFLTFLLYHAETDFGIKVPFAGTSPLFSITTLEIIPHHQPSRS